MGFKGKKTNVRRFSGGGPRPDLNAIHRKEAEEMLFAWRSLSPQEQLLSLDSRLGKGVGAKKQRSRIVAKIEAAKAPKAKSRTDKKTEGKSDKK